jgi:hypothetical protein
MARSRLAPVFVVLVALTIFVSGMLAYKISVGSPAAPSAARAGSGAQSDLLTIEGRALVQVYHADGTNFATWRGHNALTNYARNGIAGCISGLTTAPFAYGRCSNWVPWMRAYVLQPDGTVNNGVAAPSTSTALPTGRSLVAVPICSGWRSQGTVEFLYIQGTLNGAAVDTDSAIGGVQFDKVDITPGIPVKIGDRAVITITFTVS